MENPTNENEQPSQEAPKPEPSYDDGVRASLAVLAQVRNDAVVIERDALNRAIIAVEKLIEADIKAAD
jgi:hypothetical protein